MIKIRKSFICECSVFGVFDQYTLNCRHDIGTGLLCLLYPETKYRFWEMGWDVDLTNEVGATVEMQ